MISTGGSPEAERFGYDVLGPIVAEFCLRLWSVATQMDRSDDVALLFCARGGLRLQMAYERFLMASELPAPAVTASLMVSRLVALRSSLWRTVQIGTPELEPAARTAISYEFARRDLADLVRAVGGAGVGHSGGQWSGPVTSERVGALLAHPDSDALTTALAHQATLFERHLSDALSGRRHAVLVDTGLYGTTRALLSEGIPDVGFSSALIARSHRPSSAGCHGPDRSIGLSVTASEYSSLNKRTALLRYWHFIEWFLEPELPSVRSFSDVDGTVRSNLEVDGWRDKVAPQPGTAYAGVLSYLELLPRGPGARVASDARRAWPRFRNAVVWPSNSDGRALTVGTRSHDFGLDGTWSERPVNGAIRALRGSSMWREGEIARSRSPLRLPLLLAIESAYGARLVTRTVSARLLPRRTPFS